MTTDYVFQPDALTGIFMKWEPGDEPVVQGLEPFADLHPTFMKYELDARFTEPCAELLGLEPDELNMFTEKLNYKRAAAGGKYALHQDYPYWIDQPDDPENMVTVWVALDDADRENACLEVLPGSHKLGHVPGKVGGTEFEKNEIDPATFDTSGMIHVEVASRRRDLLRAVPRAPFRGEHVGPRPPGLAVHVPEGRPAAVSPHDPRVRRRHAEGATSEES